MTQFDLFELSVYLQWAGSLLIILFAFISFKNRPEIISILGYYGLFSFLFQGLQTANQYLFSGYYRGVIGNIYVLFEIGCFLCLYYVIFIRRAIRISILSIAFLYLILFLLTTTHQISVIDSATQTLRDFILIVCAVSYFFLLIIELPENNLQKLPMFWINSAILFFFSCTFMLSLSINYILDALRDDFILYWTFRNFLRTLFCAIMCVGIWQARKQRVVSPKIIGQDL